MTLCELKRTKLADLYTMQNATSAAGTVATRATTCRARDNTNYCGEGELDPQPSLLAAIAQELTNIHGGSLVQLLRGARRLLEEAFEAIEQSERPPYGVPDVASCSTRKPAELALAG